MGKQVNPGWGSGLMQNHPAGMVQSQDSDPGLCTPSSGLILFAVSLLTSVFLLFLKKTINDNNYMGWREETLMNLV